MSFNSYDILIIISTLILSSTIASIVFQYYTYSKIKKIAQWQSNYLEEFEVFKDKLIEIRMRLFRNRERIDLVTVSDIRTLLYSFQNKCDGSLTKNDREHLESIMSLLELSNTKDETYTPNFDEKLCAELDYFIARFNRTNNVITTNN